MEIVTEEELELDVVVVGVVVDTVPAELDSPTD